MWSRWESNPRPKTFDLGIYKHSSETLSYRRLTPEQVSARPAFLFLTIAPEGETQQRSRISYAPAPESGALKMERGRLSGQTPYATIKQREEVQHG